MKRRNFIQKSVLATTVLTAGLSTTQAKAAALVKEFYELRIYELKGNQTVMNNYLSKALIPVLNKFGVNKVGVFGEMGKPEPFKLYLFIPYPSFEKYYEITTYIKKDETYAQASLEYNQLKIDQALYIRYASSFMTAFDGLPKMLTPVNSDSRLFELRTYESYSEDALRRKIKMFDEEELSIFYRTKLNPVFFGEVMAGPTLPCLTYMLTFKNMEERDANWKAFIADADWQRVSKMPAYADTVSKIHRTFLEPLPYSQV